MPAPSPSASASEYSLHPSPYDPRAAGAADLEVIRQLAQTRSFRLGMPSDAHLTPDGKSVLFLRSPARDPVQSLWTMDLASGNARELVSPASLLAGPETLSAEERVRRERMRVRTRGFTSLELSEDGARALVTLSGRVWAVELATGKSTELATGKGAAIDPHLSRDGKRVAFVRDDDLHVAPVDGGRETQVTRGGTERVTHGLAEFIAGEELDRHRGFWWSPDGARLLYEEANTTHVDVLTIADPFHAEQPAQRIAYPRPGRPNADLRFGIVPSAGGPTTWVQWDHARFPYVAQASWPKGGPPLLFVLERLQRVGQLLAVDPATGKTRVLVEDRDDAWVNIDPSVPRWLPDGSGFLWASDAGAASAGTAGPEWRLELRDPAGKLVRSLLPAGFGYVAVADVDDKARTAVVEASADPTATSLWRISLDGNGAPERIGPERGEIAAHFDESHAMFVARQEALDAMPRVLVRSLDGTTARELPSLSEAPKLLAGVEMEEVGPDHVRVAIVRPRGYRPDRRYAVIDAAYGGPHVNIVSQSALGYIRSQWMADATGAIVVAMDARGTPRRGHDWERAIAGKLGAVPLEGHVATLKALGEKHPEMDMTRVGVYGWSFGGYFSALAVLARPDVYRVGAAGAPPADWRDYDTAYTERYLGLPQESAAAYDEASVLTYARKPVEGDAAARPLLILHGTADDNVWFLNSLKLADALERAKRPFTLFPISGVTHMPLEEDLNESLWLRVADTLRDALRAPE